MGEHILMYLQGDFFMMMKIFGWVKSFFCWPPPPPQTHVFLLSTQQPSQEWSSHPCKAVTAWLCVCVWAETSTLSPILREDSVRVGLRSGMEATVPIRRKQNPTQALCITEQLREEQSENKKKTLQENKLRLCTP